MGLFFKNDLHDEFGTWPLGYTAAGGVDVGVIIAVAQAVANGEDSADYSSSLHALPWHERHRGRYSPSSA